MKPQFIGIGAQKAGTTWLHIQLKEHPQLWLPPKKELHFYDGPKYPRFLKLIHPSTKIRGNMKKHIKRHFAEENNRSWYFKYYFLPTNNFWYESLFKPSPNQIAGEITPYYAILPKKTIAAIYKRNPNLKIIILLRNPIERIWSAVAMKFKKSKKILMIKKSDKEILPLLKEPKNIARSSYYACLHNWLSYFPREQIFIGYHDQIKQDPRGLLNEIFSFLGLPNFNLSTTNLGTIHNKGSYSSMPLSLKKFIANELLEDIEQLHQLLDNPYTAAWLADAKKVGIMQQSS